MVVDQLVVWENKYRYANPRVKVSNKQKSFRAFNDYNNKNRCQHQRILASVGSSRAPAPVACVQLTNYPSLMRGESSTTRWASKCAYVATCGQPLLSLQYRCPPSMAHCWPLHWQNVWHLARNFGGITARTKGLFTMTARQAWSLLFVSGDIGFKDGLAIFELVWIGMSVWSVIISLNLILSSLLSIKR